MFVTILERNENIAELEKCISIECGKPMKIKYLEKEKQEADIQIKKSSKIENFAQGMDLPFNVIE